MAAGTQGSVTQVIGSTFDAQFPESALPEIYNAITVQWQQDGATHTLYGEVQQHLGGGQVRAVPLGSTDGMTRGMATTDTGHPVAVPAAGTVLGRLSTLLPEPLGQPAGVGAL